MKDFYLYSYTDTENFKYQTTISVLFVHQIKVDKQKLLIDEIEVYFQHNILTEKLIVIFGEYANEELKNWFLKDFQETFRRVTGIDETFFGKDYIVYGFNQFLDFEICFGNNPCKDHDSFIKSLFRHGSVQIFKTRGGLVESSADHHFVFPSGKHCAKFIRTGNVLNNSAETFFLAIQLLDRFNGKKQIYCDTSSINVLPFAVLEIMRRFDGVLEFPTINSFESYSIFESKTNRFSKDALVLISSSTSGNIIDRILLGDIAKREQLVVLYYLGPEENYRQHEINIVCNLTRGNSFLEGITPFETYDHDGDCKLCHEFSRPIPIQSDVFLTVQPKLEQITFKVTDAPNGLSKFVEDYRGGGAENCVLKSYYRRETSTNGEYEVFVDTKKLFEIFPSGKFQTFAEKIKRKINTNIPANVRYLLHLADDGSVKLAQYIQEQISCKNPPELVHVEELSEKIKNVNGSIVVVASSIVTGRHLLHISRLLREKTELSFIYFIGVFRSNNKEASQTLKSNLGRGKDGAGTYPVVAVQEIFCSNRKNHSSWEIEKGFIEDLIAELNEDDDSELLGYIQNRREVLLKNKESIGLADDVFLLKTDGGKLELRKGFAFWDFQYEVGEICQSEVYFTISCLINEMKNSSITSARSLRQSNYVRNLIAPENFHRFNDGIIQASILRAGEPECFAYDLCDSASLEMRTLIESMLDQIGTTHGEAIMEILLAIGMKKLRLMNDDLMAILKLGSESPDSIVKSFCKYINAHVAF